MLSAAGQLRHLLRHIRAEFAGHEPSVLVRVRGALQAGQERLHEDSPPLLPCHRLALASGRQDLNRALVGFILRRQPPFERQLLGRRDLPSRDTGFEKKEDVLGHHPPGEVLQMIHRDRLGRIRHLGIPGHQIPQLFGMHILRGTGMARKENHHAVLASHFARQIVIEDGVQPPQAGVLVVQFDDFLEFQVPERVGHHLCVSHRSAQLWRHQIVIDSDHQAPGLVIQPFWPTDLSGGGRRSHQDKREDHDPDLPPCKSFHRCLIPRQDRREPDLHLPDPSLQRSRRASACYSSHLFAVKNVPEA